MKTVVFIFLFLPVLLKAQTIHTVAGDGSGTYSGDGSAATSASFYYPAGVAVDVSGNIYIADAVNSVIRKVNTAGIISTFAGNGTSGFSGDYGPATAAELNQPGSLAVDAYGDLFIADVGNARIRRVSSSGIISTFAGGGGSLAEGANDTAYSLSGPMGIAFDAADNMYISDGGRIHELTSAGYIFTIAGNDETAFSGDGGPATAAVFNNPGGVAVDGSGNIYIADVYNFRIREINTSGIITTVAGNGDGVASGYGTYSGDNGPAIAASLNFPTDIAVGPGGVYIADRNNNRIRRINAGNITTIAGDGMSGFGGDGGSALDCQLSYPGSVAFDATGSLYIADELNNRIRKVTDIPIPTGIKGEALPGKVAVYPNPSCNVFTVTGIVPNDQIILYDLCGRQVYTGVANGDELQIDISKLNAAIYLIMVCDQDGNIKTRLTAVKY